MNLGFVEENREPFMLQMSKLLLAAAAGEDAGEPARQVNLQLTGMKSLTPEERETLLLAVFHQLLRAIQAGSQQDKRPYLEGFHSLVFQGLPFPALPVLLELWEGFACWRERFAENYAQADRLYSLSQQLAQENPLLAYAVWRGILDRLMSSAQFLERLELCRTLVDCLEGAGEPVKQAALEMGADLFFYEGREGFE